MGITTAPMSTAIRKRIMNRLKRSIRRETISRFVAVLL